MRTNMNKGGRPPKYSIAELKETLYDVVKNSEGEIITDTYLAKKTKYPRHVWRNNKEIHKEIEKINNMPILLNISNDSMFELPSAEDFVERSYKNKKSLISNVQSLLDVCESLIEKAQRVKDLQKDLYSLKENNKNLLQKNKVLAEQYEDSQRQLFKLVIENSKLRRDLGIADKILDMEDYMKNKRENKSRVTETFEEFFKDL